MIRSTDDSTGPQDQFTGPHRFQVKEWIACAPFEQLLGLKIMKATEGRATLTMPFVVDLAQGGGFLHGGALVSLADTAVVMAIKSVLPPMTHFATIDLQTQFLYPVKQGIVTAEAEISLIDEKMLYGQAMVYNETGQAVVSFISTFKIAGDTRIRNVSFISSTPP